MTKELALIFDGNYLFYKSMSVANGYAKNSKKQILSDEEDVNVLVRKVATDFVSTLNRFQNVSKIIFTKDVSSWRKKFYPDYKGNRKKDSNINWTNMFNAMDEFLEILKTKGVIVSTLEGAEGDDLMYLWSNHFLNTKTCSTVVCTGDGDLHQIIDYNDEVFSVIFNNNSTQRKFVVKENFNEYLLKTMPDDSDKFDFDNVFSDNFSVLDVSPEDSLCEAMAHVDVDEIKPIEVSLYKAICGDDGDNIPSVYSWINDKKAIKRITRSHYMKLKDALIEQYGEIDMEQLYSNKSLQNFVRVKLQSYANTTIPQDVFNKNLVVNITLSYLNKLVIPQEIQDKFIEHVKEVEFNSSDTFNNISLLEGTKFAKAPGAITSNVFKTLKR